MPNLVIVEHDGTRHELQVDKGKSVMTVAVENAIPGVIGDCGGNLACATCHVYVDAPWSTIVGAATTDERDMLECALHLESNSRLGCQIHMTDDLNGLVVRLPVSQT